MRPGEEGEKGRRYICERNDHYKVSKTQLYQREGKDMEHTFAQWVTSVDSHGAQEKFDFHGNHAIINPTNLPLPERPLGLHRDIK